MRLVFFGSGEFGVRALEAMVAGVAVPALVVSQPDRPAGRGGRASPTPIRRLAERLGLPVAAPERPNHPDFVAELAALAPDLAVVVAYGHLIRKPLLELPRLGFVNLHASLLPAYRGAAPVPWAIMNGERESGVTVFQLDERFDSGAVLARASLAIAPDDTSKTYLDKLAPLGAGLLAETALALAAGQAVPQRQDESAASSAPRLGKADGAIDWTRPCAEIERRVRALQPWPRAYAVLPVAGGAMRASILRLSRSGLDGKGAEPGSVVLADPDQGLFVMAGDAPARLEMLQPEGRRPMPDRDFLRGNRVIA